MCLINQYRNKNNWYKVRNLTGETTPTYPWKISSGRNIW